MANHPDPMAQIEAQLRVVVNAAIYNGNAHGRGGVVQAADAAFLNKQEAALLALIRSALSPQPGQKEAENAWKQLECVGLSVRGRQVTLLFKNDPTAKTAFKRLNGINATPPTPAPDEPVPDAIKTISNAMHADPDGYAWSWHCNIAMAAIDAGADRLKAQKQAATFLYNLTGIRMWEVSEHYKQWERDYVPDIPAPDEAGVRAKFEAWAKPLSLYMRRLENDTRYESNEVEWAYRGYRAALLGEKS